jgi:hypothetical protein
VADSFPDYDYRSPVAARKRVRDARIFTRIMRSRDFHWAVALMFAITGKDIGLKWMVTALIRVVGKDALLNEVTRQCKKDPWRPPKGVPPEALTARRLLRTYPGMNLSRAVCLVIDDSADTNHPKYKSAYYAASRYARELDKTLDALPDLPEGLDLCFDLDEFLKENRTSGVRSF